MRFDGDPTNQRAGSVQGYNSLPGLPPLHRSELYQLWWRQELFDRKLILRVGKMVPTADFNNVLRPVPTQDQSLFIPSVSGLLFTPVFVNPTLLGVMPGYYNSACGVTTTFAPTKNFYFSYGVYDGNIANGTQTGTRGPEFNGYYFNICEAGAAWQIGSDNLPGSFGVGVWHQSGPIARGGRNRIRRDRCLSLRFPANLASPSGEGQQRHHGFFPVWREQLGNAPRESVFRIRSDSVRTRAGKIARFRRRWAWRGPG